jgi:hypothetical protein
MKNKLISIGFNAQMIHIYTLTQIKDSTTVIPENIDTCLEYLDKIGLSESDILCGLFYYHCDLASLVTFSDSYDKLTTGLFYDSFNHECLSIVHANKTFYVPFSKVIKCEFTAKKLNFLSEK